MGSISWSPTSTHSRLSELYLVWIERIEKRVNLNLTQVMSCDPMQCNIHARNHQTKQLKHSYEMAQG